jgi:hypothetical protein
MNAQLIDLQKIWDQAPHNALTDLIRYKSLWFCVFRAATDHISPDGKIQVLVSEAGTVWKSVTLLEIPGLDLRDPKLSIAPSGQLMLNAGAAFQPRSTQKQQSLVWFSPDGIEWSDPIHIGDLNYWLWRICWHREIAYGIGYHTVEPAEVRLYSSRDGASFTLTADKLFVEGWPNEATLLFQKDNSALCLLRRDSNTATAMLGKAQPPYETWTWSDLGVRVGGPNLLLLPDGRIVAAIRRYGKNAWTSLNWLDPIQNNLEEFLVLPSGGDTSYAGLRWHADMLWVSYYSSHEQKTSVYLAKVQVPCAGA